MSKAHAPNLEGSKHKQYHFKFLLLTFSLDHHAKTGNTRVTSSHKNKIKAQMIPKNGFYFITDPGKDLNDLFFWIKQFQIQKLRSSHY